MATANTKSVWVVIAAYNEGSVIGDVVRETIKTFRDIVVVDDGSKDDTAKFAQAAGAVVLRHPINLGQGAALQTGIDYAVGQDATAIITFDADGQHRTEDAHKMLNFLADKNFDIVCGSRFLSVNSTTLPFKRKMLLKAAAFFTRLTTGIPVTDAHNGLRVLSRKAAREIRITQNRMAHASEIISQVYLKKLSFAEFPVEIIYSSYSLAKGQRMTNSINILLDLFFARIGK